MDRTRRAILRTLTLGGLAAMGAPTAEAQGPRRFLPEVPPEIPPEIAKKAGGRAAGQSSADLRRFVEDVRMGPGQPHGELLVVWLQGRPGMPLEVATLDEARGRGQLAITERDQARVPDLVVDNRGKTHVLLLAGEILVGGKQNRVLGEDLLLPPYSGPRSVGVYCVEARRWNESRRDFESKGSFAAPGLRSQVLSRADQGRVWSEVDRYARAAAAPSPTANFQAVYEKAEVRAHVEATERGLPPPSGILGAAVFVGDRLVGIDLFHDPALFGRLWPKLLRAHALEAFGLPARGGGRVGAGEGGRRARLREVLGGIVSAVGQTRGNAGVGHVFEFSLSHFHGAALLFEGRVPHLVVA
jgi:ARG and Rhodanese-Phosphatase-superfamily-associated Protein domain